MASIKPATAEPKMSKHSQSIDDDVLQPSDDKYRTVGDELKRRIMELDELRHRIMEICELGQHAGQMIPSVKFSLNILYHGL